MRPRPFERVGGRSGRGVGVLSRRVRFGRPCECLRKGNAQRSAADQRDHPVLSAGGDVSGRWYRRDRREVRIAGQAGAAAGEVQGEHQLPRRRRNGHGLLRGESQAKGKVAAPQTTVKDLVPAKYNTNTELQVEVTAKGPNTFDFDLR